MNTKEKILVAALRLFAVNGYEAVSVSQIAGELGITKGALYKHYKNKRDIFNCIFEYVCHWMWNALEKAASRNRIIRICRRLFPMYPQKV